MISSVLGGFTAKTVTPTALLTVLACTVGLTQFSPHNHGYIIDDTFCASSIFCESTTTVTIKELEIIFVILIRDNSTCKSVANPCLNLS